MYGGGGKQTPQLFRVLCPPKKWCARGLSLSPNFHPALCAALEIGAGLGHWAEMVSLGWLQRQVGVESGLQHLGQGTT